MKQKRWSKEGRKLRKTNPSLFTVGIGKQPHPKGGVHIPETAYSRADTRNEERKAQLGDC